MRILIYGAGVIGSIFAGKLALAGNDITVLARGKRFETLKNEGIMVEGIQESRLVLRKNGIKPTPQKLLWLDLPISVLTLSFSIFMR